MIKIGIIGAGKLGRVHIGILKKLIDFEIIGLYDTDLKMARSTSDELNIPLFYDFDELITEVDAIDIVSPVLPHYDFAEKALKNVKHVFVEKPITNTLEEARRLMRISEEANVKIQVGHVERFNPAFVAAREHSLNPLVIESNRLLKADTTHKDVSLVLDLMVHDIDIVLKLVRSNVKKVQANGVTVVGETPDIVTARIEFDNGCVANFTTSRIAEHDERETKLFQTGGFISIDFLNKKAHILKQKKNATESKIHAIPVLPANAINEELISFARAIKEDTNPLVTVGDGYNSLEVAFKVLESLKLTPNLMEENFS